MQYEIVVHRSARGDVLQVYRRAAHNAPVAAEKWLARLQRKIQTLQSNPERNASRCLSPQCLYLNVSMCLNQLKGFVQRQCRAMAWTYGERGMLIPWFVANRERIRELTYPALRLLIHLIWSAVTCHRFHFQSNGFMSGTPTFRKSPILRVTIVK